MAVLVEMGWGGLVQAPWSITWTDITNRVDQGQGVTITRGASDELSETQPGTATMTLDNLDGALTPGNPNSPYYPYVRKNAPVRVSVAYYPAKTGAAPYPLSMLVDDFDNGVVDPAKWTTVGGSAEVGGRLRQPMTSTVARHTSVREWSLAGSQLTVKLCTVPAAGGSSSASASWYVYSATSGTRLRWSYNPLTNQLRAAIEVGGADAGGVNLAYSAIDHAWLRVRETSGTVFMETSPDGWDWTVRRSAATPAWVNSDMVQVEFAATRTGGTPDYIEWDYLGAMVRPRFYGTVNEWPVEWEGLLSSVTISATDLFKRLNRLPALMSCLSEEIRVLAPAVYYPLTEPTESTSAGDLSGTTAGPLTIAQASVGGTLTFGTTPGPAAAADALPLLTPASSTAGKYLTADMGAAYQSATTSGWNMMECWFQTSTPGRVIFALLGVAGTMRMVWALGAGGALQVETSVDGDIWQTVTVTTGNLADGKLHHLVYDEVLNQVYVDGAAKTSSGFIQLMVTLRTLSVGAYANARLWSGTIGHIALHATPSVSLGPTMATHYQAGIDAYAGEDADTRITRLARYGGVNSVTIHGSTHDPIAGQGDAGSTVVARMREVETTESGRLYAERDYFGLAYQSRDLRYNPDASSEVFAIAYADLEPGVQLADDDQKLVNAVEASRPGGATQSITAASSILAYGRYEKPLTLLKTSDNSVTDAAYWIVSRYADPAPEIREVPIEAYTMPQYLDILDADISSYFTVYDLPSQAPTLEARVTVEGYTETIREQSHLIQYRTSASATDSVWILDDPVYSQLNYTTRLAY